MKILHIASFSGNIGDVANHSGFYHQFSKLVNKSIEQLEITKLEIRKFYKRWRELEFDENFVVLANQYDLVVLGGGNFFELCWDYSETGTTFNISEENLLRIKTPIFINGIGIDDNKGTSIENVEKFKRFLHVLKKKGNVFFTVRNDGSYEIVKKRFSEYKDFIFVVPDHGFFIKDIVKGLHANNNIGINIAIDMKEKRYDSLSYEGFIQLLAKQVNKICKDTSYNLILFPHISSDYLAILNLLDLVDDEHVRTRISIAPLIQGQELETFKYYLTCKLIFAMRFHANVCALSLGVPVIPIISYPKHAKLYEEIKAENWVLDINSETFSNKLEEQVSLLCSGKQVGHKLSDLNNKIDLVQQKELVYEKLYSWLKGQNLV